MARIKVPIPNIFHFITMIHIRISDLNYGGHVGNDTILTLIHEARVQFLQHFSYSEFDLEGASLIMADVAIEFKAELFYGDAVKVFITAHDFSRAGFDLTYKLINPKDDKTVAIAKTGMVCFDYKNRKVMALPELAKIKLTKTESNY